MSSSRLASVFLAGFVAVASAAEPTLIHLFPVAGTQGTTVSVAAAGKFDPWPPQVWVDAPGITFHAAKTAGKFDVEVAKDATPGPHLVRFYNEQGASAPRFFIVSSEPELLEVEPNDNFKSPQKIDKLPVTINGRLDKAGDVDCFAVALKKGETLTAGVEAYVLASTFDGMLRLVDEDGTEVAFNHDDGRTLDPLLIWRAPRDGTFVVQLMGFIYPANSSVGLTGGEGCVYRLHLSATAAPAPRDIAPDSEPTVQESSSGVPVGSTPPLAIPVSVAGCIRKAGQENRHLFQAVKKQPYQLRVIAEQTGSPLDAWLKIEDQDGKQLGRNDDVGSLHDPLINWTAQSDGVFVAVVGDTTHRGGAGYVYRLEINEAVPSVAATSASHGISVMGGKTAEVKVTVKRTNGFKSKVMLAAKSLPEGVSAPEVEVPEKDGEVTLKISAEADAAPTGQPFQVVLREVESGTEHPVSYFMTAVGENNGVTQGYTKLVIDSTDKLWLTVVKAAADAEKPKAEAASKQ